MNHLGTAKSGKRYRVSQTDARSQQRFEPQRPLYPLEAYAFNQLACTSAPALPLSQCPHALLQMVSEASTDSAWHLLQKANADISIGPSSVGLGRGIEL